MDEIENLMLQLEMTWSIDGRESPREQAVQRLLEIGESAIPILISELKRNIRCSAGRTSISYDDIVGSDKRGREGILLVLEKSGYGTVPALIDICLNDDKKVRDLAFYELFKAARALKSVEQAMKIEKCLKEHLFGITGKACVALHDFGISAGKLMMLIAERKNELTKDRGIHLGDIPKPPKKDGMYHEIRRRTING